MEMKNRLKPNSAYRAASLTFLELLTACQARQTPTSGGSLASAKGVAADRLAALTQVVQADIDAKRIPGAVIAWPWDLVISVA